MVAEHTLIILHRGKPEELTCETADSSRETPFHEIGQSQSRSRPLGQVVGKSETSPRLGVPRLKSISPPAICTANAVCPTAAADNLRHPMPGQSPFVQFHTQS